MVSEQGRASTPNVDLGGAAMDDRSVVLPNESRTFKSSKPKKKREKSEDKKRTAVPKPYGGPLEHDPTTHNWYDLEPSEWVMAADLWPAPKGGWDGVYRTTDEHTKPCGSEER